MNRSSFFNEILPSIFSTPDLIPAGDNSLVVYDNKIKDVNFIKKIAREKIKLHGAPILYFPILTNSLDTQFGMDNILKEQTDLVLGAPIDMVATWTPQEYQLDLSKFGVIMPSGSDQQLFIHVDELSDKLQRKPLMGDIIETKLDRTRYKVADVFFGHSNLWENIFCMLTLTKVAYDNYTSQLDVYDETYADTYTKLENVLDMMSGEEVLKSNAEIQEVKRTTDSVTTKPRKKSIDTATLDLMTMVL